MPRTSRIVLAQQGGLLGLVALSMAGCFGSTRTQPRSGVGDARSATPSAQALHTPSTTAPATGLNTLGSATNIEIPAKPSREDVPRLAQEQADILNRLIAEGVIKPDAVINPGAMSKASTVTPVSPTMIYNTPAPIAPRYARDRDSAPLFHG